MERKILKIKYDNEGEKGKTIDKWRYGIMMKRWIGNGQIWEKQSITLQFEVQRGEKSQTTSKMWKQPQSNPHTNREKVLTSFCVNNNSIFELFNNSNVSNHWFHSQTPKSNQIKSNQIKSTQWHDECWMWWFYKTDNPSHCYNQEDTPLTDKCVFWRKGRILSLLHPRSPCFLCCIDFIKCFSVCFFSQWR